MPTTTLPYNSFMREMMNVADALNRTAAERGYDYAQSGGSVTPVNRAEMAVRLPLDVWADESGYTLQAYVPGVNPDDVEITFEEDELTIRGAFAPRPEGAEYLKRELFHGRFERRVTFNKPVAADGIEATYNQGVLTLRVPKAEVVKPRQIKVVAR